MDATNAQTSFVEIAFVVNTSFAFYTAFRDRFQQNVNSFQAMAYTIESRDGDVRRLNTAKTEVSRYANQHFRIQQASVRIATLLSQLGAVACVTVLYFDVLGDLGRWAGCLMLPFPIYIFVSLCNYGLFRARAAWKLRHVSARIFFE